VKKKCHIDSVLGHQSPQHKYNLEMLCSQHLVSLSLEKG